MIQDAKGRMIPSWARYVENIAAGGTHSGYKESEESGNYVPFALYLYDDSTITFTTLEGGSVTHTFGPGYHAIAFATITACSGAALALFAYKPENA